MIVPQQLRPLLFRCTGAFGGYERWLAGEISYEDAYNNTAGLAGVYQLRRRYGREVPVQMVFSRPTNPQTKKQQSWRHKFKEGVYDYQHLTPEQKLPYARRGGRSHRSAFNVYMSDYLERRRVLG